MHGSLVNKMDYQKLYVDRVEESITTFFDSTPDWGTLASPTGRFKTLPAADTSLSKLRFAYISCQDYTNGYFTALNYLA